MWMRSCAVCKAILRKRRWSDVVRCQLRMDMVGLLASAKGKGDGHGKGG